MTRVLMLTWFLIRDLFRSLAGIVPLAAALAFGLIAVEYGTDQAQFVTVAGLGIGTICLLTTLLLTSRANQASSYLLLARTRHRSQLLAALVIGGLAITTVLSFLTTGANLLANRLTLDFPSALWIVPTWLVLWFLATALALDLSALAARGGSHLFAWVLLTALLVANDRKAKLQSYGLSGLVQILTFLLWPISTLLSRASANTHDQSYFLALASSLGYAFVLFWLSVRMFRGKDLLWSE
jgi:hypothetical protein